MRDFVYIDDVIRAIFFSIKRKKAKGEIINIGTGKPNKIREIIEKIKSIIKRGEPLYGQVNLRKDEVIRIFPNVSKAKKILNWKSKIAIDYGLKKTIEHYKKEYEKKK